MTLKISFLQFLRGQNKLEVIQIIGIKKLFDCNLFMGKNWYPVNWAALISTTVDTLLKGSVIQGMAKPKSPFKIK